MGPLAEASFGAALRECRIRQGVTLAELSRRVHYSQAFLSRVETGQRAPSAELARSCDEALAAAGKLEQLAVPCRGTRGSGGSRPACLPWSVPRFIGRAAELGELDAVLASNTDGVPVVAITGTPGVGKTTLAVHFAHRVADRFTDGQLFADLRGFGPSARPAAPDEAIRGLLEALGVPPTRMPASLAAQTGLYRTLLTGRKVLVVLDNARDAEQVVPLLPGSPGSMVLVTSRDQLSSLVAGGACSLELDLLSGSEAHGLLSARVGADRVAAEPQAAAQIISRCGGLPLALSVAAARAMARPVFPLAALAAEFCGDKSDSLPVNQDVSAVFSWSLDALNPAAARLFRLLGLAPTAEITVPAAASLAGIAADQARCLLAELAAAHLLSEPAPGRFGCHDLLHAYALRQVAEKEDQDERAEATRRLLDHYLHSALGGELVLNPHRKAIVLGPPAPGVVITVISGQAEALEWFGAERRMLVAVVAHAAETGWHSHTWQLAWSTWTYLNRQGHWHDKAAVQQYGLTSARQIGDIDATCQMLHSLATAHARLGHYDDALDYLRQAVELLRRTGNRAGLGRAYMSLAVLRSQQSRPDESLDYAVAALHEFEAIGDERGQANALNLVGWFEVQTGRPLEALDHCMRALALHQRLGNPQGEAHARDSIGYIRYRLGEFNLAIGCFERALTILRAIGERYNEADTLIHLGDAHDAAGDDCSAAGAWRRALEILADMDHPRTAEVRDKLAGQRVVR